MPLIVLLRGANVGGHRRFRPSELARQLQRYDVVNIGAAGTFVARKPASRAQMRAAVLERLTFATDVVFCESRELRQLVTSAPFGAEAPCADRVRFISFLERSIRAAPLLPLTIPSSGPWFVRVVAVSGRLAAGEYRRHMKTIGYLGLLDELLGVRATTRSWRTIEAILRVADGQD